MLECDARGALFVNIHFRNYQCDALIVNVWYLLLVVSFLAISTMSFPLGDRITLVMLFFFSHNSVFLALSSTKLPLSSTKHSMHYVIQ